MFIRKSDYQLAWRGPALKLAPAGRGERIVVVFFGFLAEKTHSLGLLGRENT